MLPLLRIPLKQSSNVERMDAVMYCLSALEKFAGLAPGQVQKIGFEIALLGANGIDVNDSAEKYTLLTSSKNFLAQKPDESIH